MILTGHEIIKQHTRHRLTISPFDRNLVNPNSYNYRLGSDLLEFPQDTIDPKQLLTPHRHSLNQQGIILQPGRLYLGHTLEVLGSHYYSTSLIGRSSLGRLGLWLQVTADLGHVGTAQRWTLEMKVVQPLKIYPGMRIGQITFWQTYGRQAIYQGQYNHDQTVQASRIRQELL